MKMFKFTAVEFNHNPMFYEWDEEHKYPSYSVTERYELPPMEFDDLWEAEEWFVRTYPQYCIGYNIVEIDREWRKSIKGGDFVLGAVLDYYVGLYGRDIDIVYERTYEEHLKNFEHIKRNRN